MAARSGIDAEELAAVLQQTREALLGPGFAAAEQPPEEVRGEGRDPADLVRAVVTSAGRVESIELRHRAIREGSEELGAMVVAAVNGARADLREKLRERAVPPLAGWNPEALLRMQRETTLRLSGLVDQLTESMHKVSRAAGTAD